MGLRYLEIPGLPAYQVCRFCPCSDISFTTSFYNGLLSIYRVSMVSVCVTFNIHEDAAGYDLFLEKKRYLYIIIILYYIIITSLFYIIWEIYCPIDTRYGLNKDINP
jgi:hypothetical protein